MTDQEKQAKLAEMVSNTLKSLRDCERFADEHKLSFSWSPFYGGGGWYEGDPDQRRDGWGDPSDEGWSSSSHGC